MSAMQRNKGKAGEREVAAMIRDLTGWDVRRRVRQHDGDSDLVGVPGWVVEVKRHKTAARHEISAWWRQTVDQASNIPTGDERRPVGRLALPVLFFRKDRDDWRAVWPVNIEAPRCDYVWTAEGSVEAWAYVARESQA